MGPETLAQNAGSLPRKFTSIEGPKYVCIRVAPPLLMPELPPSPPTDSNQLEAPSQAQVPLSCVPPMTSPYGRLRLIDTDCSCRVLSPVLSESMRCGTDASVIRQNAKSAAAVGSLNVRAPHTASPGLPSTNVPFVRTTPPSEPTNASAGLLGLSTRACWSGCIPSFGFCTSLVMSVNDTPASVDRTTARPFERGCVEPKAASSSYAIDPPSHTVSALDGSATTKMSYPHWPFWQKL